MGSEVLSLIIRATDEASREVAKVTKSFHGLASGARSIAGGAFGALKGAIGGVLSVATSLPGILAGGGLVAGLTAAANAAADDAASVARLQAAIKANVAGNADYTAQLERTIAAGQRLAFTDDDTRASLTRLVTSTRDVTEATKLNAIAMDLARLKGTTLEDAANIIGKVHDGNVGILSRYGITVEKGATATQALAQIQAAAAGQAQTYADSSRGAMDRLQDGFAEAGESIGALVLPAMQALVSFATENILPALQSVIGLAGDWIGKNQQLITDVGSFVSGALTQLWTTFTTNVLPALQTISEAWGRLVTIIVERVVPVVLDLARRVWDGGLNRVIGAAAKIIGSVYTVFGNLMDAITSNQAIMDALRTAADLIGGAFGFVADAISGVIDWLGQVGDWITGNKPLMAGLKAVVDGWATAFGAVVTAVQGLIGFLRDLVGFVEKNFNVFDLLFGSGGTMGRGPAKGAAALGNVPTGGGPKSGVVGPGVPGRAAGGPVLAGRPYVVGERGPELFLPGSSGTIVPGGAGASVTFAPGAVVVNGVQDPAALARDLVLHVKRELTRQGVTFSGGY